MDEIDWKFLSGRVTGDITAILYFAGKSFQHSLTGGCGWWVVHNDVVIAYGSAPVQQNFPSMIRLEYEGLLNGLQSAIRKGLTKIIVRSCCNLILAHLYRGIDNFPYIKTIVHDIKDLYIAVVKSFKQLQYYEFQLINPEKNFYAQRLAEKAFVDYEKQSEMIINRKLQMTNGIPEKESNTHNPTSNKISSYRFSNNKRNNTSSNLHDVLQPLNKDIFNLESNAKYNNISDVNHNNTYMASYIIKYSSNSNNNYYKGHTNLFISGSSQIHR